MSRAVRSGPSNPHLGGGRLHSDGGEYAGPNPETLAQTQPDPAGAGDGVIVSNVPIPNSPDVVRSAVDDVPPPPVALTKSYEVIRGGTVNAPRGGGFPFRLNQGKVINEKDYDIPFLKKQGIVLKELQPDPQDEAVG